MVKNFRDIVKGKANSLTRLVEVSDTNRKGERADTKRLSDAREIDIERIHSDPDQPRKIFHEESLDSLAESIKELEGIIEPLIVEYIEKDDVFQIVSGDRRYRAAKKSGLKSLPCIIREIEDSKRLLIQLVANLQRENISPLDEADGFRKLINKYGYTQEKLGLFFGKSKSYVSQTLGLERLTEEARKKVQTSELSKEVQILASREESPEMQLAIIKMASDEGKSVPEIRAKISELKKERETKPSTANIVEGQSQGKEGENTFRVAYWQSKERRLAIKIHFKTEQNEDIGMDLVKEALEHALENYDGDWKMK